jgi:hypothetical protein
VQSLRAIFTTCGSIVPEMPESNDTFPARSLQVKHDLETRLIEKCWKDPEFQKQVVANPKGILETLLGRQLPQRIQIFIHEDDQNTMHLSIPPAPTNSIELSDEDLERIAGGTEFAVGVTMLIAATAASFSIERLDPQFRGGAW